MVEAGYPACHPAKYQHRTWIETVAGKARFRARGVRSLADRKRDTFCRPKMGQFGWLGIAPPAAGRGHRYRRFSVPLRWRPPLCLCSAQVGLFTLSLYPPNCQGTGVDWELSHQGGTPWRSSQDPPVPSPMPPRRHASVPLRLALKWGESGPQNLDGTPFPEIRKGAIGEVLLSATDLVDESLAERLATPTRHVMLSTGTDLWVGVQAVTRDEFHRPREERPQVP